MKNRHSETGGDFFMLEKREAIGCGGNTSDRVRRGGRGRRSDRRRVLGEYVRRCLTGEWRAEGEDEGR